MAVSPILGASEFEAVRASLKIGASSSYARSCRRPAEQAERSATHVAPAEAQAKLNGFTTLSKPARRFASRPRLRGTRRESAGGLYPELARPRGFEPLFSP
jgi:hypothetical protein